MQIWKELDEKTQNFIKYLLGFIVLIIAGFAYFMAGKYNEKLNTPIVVNKYPVKEVKLIEAYKKNGDYYMSILDMSSAKRYENIFLTSSCPNFKNNPGQKMYVMITHKVKPVTNEDVFEFERTYDYICTNKNMDAIDEKLKAELEKALKESAIYKGDTPILSQEEEASRQKMLKEGAHLINN